MSETREEPRDPAGVIAQIVAGQPRYAREAYFFVLASLQHVVSRLPRPRHVSGRELCEGIRHLAIDRFGLMAKQVLEHWGIQRTADVGAIVFQLIDAKLLSKTEQDAQSDFDDVYDFDDVFVRRFPWDRRDWDI
jgi:uncharacterized repeat protein (TIGR04138 family)